jgi:hypothetical protein
MTDGEFGLLMMIKCSRTSSPSSKHNLPIKTFKSLMCQIAINESILPQPDEVISLMHL